MSYSSRSVSGWTHYEGGRQHYVTTSYSGTCPDCGRTLTKSEDSFAFCNYQNTWVKSADGKTHYHLCKDCGDIEDRAEHSFKNGYCTVCGEKDPNYVPPAGGATDAPPDDIRSIAEEDVPLADLGAAISTTVADSGLTASAERNLDGSITVKVTDAEGKAANGGVKLAAHGITAGQVVALLDESGAVKEYIKKSVVDDGVAYALLDGSATIKIVDNAAAFSDVKTGDWYKGAVDFASSHSLFNGVSATSFAPNTNMNRAMLVTVLHRLEDTPVTSAANIFSDVGTEYYTDAVKWASSNGIVTGYEDGTFLPARNITRQEMAVILCRYMEKLGYDVSARADFSTFSDGGSVATWASDAMQWAVGAGIITGKPGNLIDPTGTATRAEVATMLMRVVKAMVI